MTIDENTMENTDAIRLLNDQFRTSLIGGRVVITQGIAQRCDANAIIAAVRVFNYFNDANDPHHEHDFGAFKIEGESKGKFAVEGATIFFKVDYYDKDLHYGSANAADPTVTERVLTIFLAEEY